ncbi:hypothetical protein ACDX66_10595 [Peribacillus frigoritolerans]
MSFDTLLVNLRYLLVSLGNLLVNFAVLLVSFEIKKNLPIVYNRKIGELPLSLYI